MCEIGLYGSHRDVKMDGMLHKSVTKARKEDSDTIRASVKKEMAKPRMAKSARITQRNLYAGRLPEPPVATMPGTVDKTIPSRSRTQPEEAQVGVNGARRQHRDLRIENSLTDEHGDDVKLKEGDHKTPIAKTRKRS